MDDNSPNRLVQDQPAVSDSPEIPEHNGETNLVLLSPAVEQQLGIAIQRGTEAANELTATFFPSLSQHIESQDLSPLPKPAVLRIAEQSVRQEILNRVTGVPDADSFGTAVAEALRSGIARLLESRRRAVDGVPIDVTGWLNDKLSLTVLRASLIEPHLGQTHLWQLVNERHAAINTLVQSHLRLAEPFARKAMSRRFEFDEVMNEAVLILRRAAELFDPAAGNRFSSYAKPALQRDLKRQPSLSAGTSRYTNGQVAEFERTQNALSQQQHSAVSADEVFQQLGTHSKTRTEIENVRRLLSAQRRAQEDSDSKAPEPADCHFSDPFENALNQEERQQLRLAFAGLDPLEKRVLVGHTICGVSFRKLGRRYHKSPQTLSQLHADVLLKLARRIDPHSQRPRPR